MPAAEAIRVVIVEDSAADAELAVYALRRHGIEAEVVVAATVPQLRAALAAPTDVVISDYSMQGLDGAIALEIAQELVPNAKFIFLSGSIFHRPGGAKPLAGASAVLDKNDMDQLGAVVMKVLHGMA